MYLQSSPSVQEGIVNAMTVDVEDYFQVAAFEDRISRSDWDRLPCRVDANTHRVLDVFAEHGVKSTFFTLGWVAERYPGLVRRIVAEGHEIASHGYDHTRLNEFDRDQLREDLLRTKGLLEDLAGTAVLGYRAPSYSIGARNLWALDVVQETGHVYSSSIYPIRHDLYGMPDAPRFPFRLRPDAILEIPVTTLRFAERNFPCGGGGYFRLMPYPLYRWAMRRVNDTDRQPGMFYFHPWEIDPTQPRVEGASLRSRFRHYVNLDTMEVRLRRLLGDFRWGRMDEVFAVRSAAPTGVGAPSTCAAS
jgi:polysaccharide deacetylase family protein (PEP-CTERM system associated)